MKKNQMRVVSILVTLAMTMQIYPVLAIDNLLVVEPAATIQPLKTEEMLTYPLEPNSQTVVLNPPQPFDEDFMISFPSGEVSPKLEIPETIPEDVDFEKKYIPDVTSSIDSETESEQEILLSANTTKDFVWNFSEDGTLTIRGNGNLNWAVVYHEPSLLEKIKKVVIEEGITGIGMGAFAECPNLTEVIIPDTVTYIGPVAFQLCTSLTNITIPSGVTAIDIGAFDKCSNLTSVTIPDSVTTIGDLVFQGCSNLTSVTIPDSITTIGDRVFQGCNKLKAAGPVGGDYNIQFSNLSIPFNMFSELTTVTIPDSITEIPKRTFENCINLTSVTLPQGLSTIGDYAFYDCTILTEITIPSSVVTIGNSAFGGCKAITEISLPYNIKTIGSYAFSGCTALEKIIIPGRITTVGSGLFNGCAKLKTAGPIGGDYNIQFSNLSIPFNMFSELTTVTIPDSITEIPELTFGNCINLTSVTLPQGLSTIGYYAFYGCEKLESIELPDRVRDIGDSAFMRCISLECITLPESVRNIGNGSFADCHGLKSLTLSNDIISIGWRSFAYCTSLENVIIPECIDDISLEMFMGCTSLNTVQLPETLKTIGSEAFADCTNLSSMIIPDGAISIGNRAFVNCTNLSSIIIPESVMAIGGAELQNCFQNCKSLTIYGKPGSVAETYADEWGIYFEPYSATITLNICDTDNKKIESGYNVIWYDSVDCKISEGNILYGSLKGQTYKYEIILDEELSYTYTQPEKTEITAPAENVEFTVTLTKIPTSTIKGLVTDENGNALKVSVKATQTFNGRYEKESSVISDTSGAFLLKLFSVPTIIEITSDGYYTKKTSITEDDFTNNEYNFGEIKLSKLPSDKVTLSISKYNAVKDGESSIKTSINSAANLTFEIKNKTKGTNITDFAVQYPNLILGEDEAEGNDVIEITATDNKKQMTANPVEITLDNNKMGSAEIVFIENGSISINSISGNNQNTIMVFKENGDFVKSYSITDYFVSDLMEEGTYKIVFIKKTDLLRSVSNISKLSELGLDEGNDYVIKTADIENGVICEIENITVPSFDESQLYYTKAENTKFFANKTSVANGIYVVLRAEYKIDEKHTTSNQKVQFELPENVSFAELSLTVNGAIHPYIKDGNTITVITNKPEGIIRFYVISTASGIHNVNSYLSFDKDGNAITQPIGTATFKGESLTISAPQKTSLTNIPLSGVISPKSKIEIYCNEEKVGETTSNSYGSWYLNFDLIKPYNYYKYEIYGIVSSDKFEGTFTTDTHTLIYDKTYPVPSKITMIHSGQEIVFDYLNPQYTVPSYTWSGESFTFLVEFAGKPENISDVYVVAETVNGNQKYVYTTYDQTKKQWIGSGKFKSTEAPVSVMLKYNNSQSEKEPLLNDKMFLDDMANYYSTIEFSNTDIEKYIESVITIDEPNRKKQLIIDKTLDNMTALETETIINTYTEHTSGELIEAGFTEVIDSDNKPIYYKLTETDISQTYEMIAPTLQLHFTYVTTVNAEWYNKKLEESDTANLSNVTNVSNTLLNSAKDILFDIFTAGVYGQIQHGITVANLRETVYNKYYLFQDKLDLTRKQVIMAKCSDGSAALSEKQMMEYINSSNKLLEEYEQRKNMSFIAIDLFHKSTAIFNGTSSLIGLSSAKNAAKIAKTSLSYTNYLNQAFIADAKESLIVMGLTMLDQYELKRIIDSDYKDMISKLNSLKTKTENEMQCPPPPEDEKEDFNPDEFEPIMKNQEQTPKKTIKPVIDPSGYVYEAVPSNRIEGVKAECYQYDHAIDDFGVPADEKSDIFWIAEDYDQKNPLYTDKRGMYYWDVPIGEWMVKFSKDGYYDTDTKNDPAANEDGYLPVPPPQTEVNTAIVSKAAPTVESVNVYNDEVQIIFSQYMKIDSLNTSNINVSCGGNTVTGTIEPTNAEYNYEKTEQFASIFRFIPESELEGSATITIEKVKNYASKAIDNKFTQTKTVVVKPESLSVAESIDVLYNSGALLEVSINPKEAGANKTLTISTLSPSIVGVVNNTVTTDENGNANVMLEGKLPGNTEITISLDGTDIRATSEAKVKNPENSTNACAKVTASIASGSTVAKGTVLTLTTETEGAQIYYTLDGTCPCVTDSSSRIKYTEPLAINDDTFIIAYAVKEGMKDSPTAGFIYTIEKSVEKVATPVASPKGSKVEKNTEITLTTATKDAIIYYTTDGKTPTANSTVYTAPIKITSSINIKAIAFKEGMTESDVMTESYTIKTESSGSSGGGGGGGGSKGGSVGGGVAVAPGTPSQSADINSNIQSKFNDVSESDWYYSAVNFAYSRGITGGVSENSFAPNQNVTRGQFITMLCRAYEIKEMTGDNFADCGNTWYTGYLAAAKQLGISNGVGDNKFAPELEITREEMVTLIYNYLKTIGKVDSENTSTSFTDDSSISDWARAGVAFASEKGYVKGKGDNKFVPQGKATRAELVQIFYNILN